jgi:hypothetical protein
MEQKTLKEDEPRIEEAGWKRKKKTKRIEFQHQKGKEEAINPQKQWEKSLDDTDEEGVKI